MLGSRKFDIWYIYVYDGLGSNPNKEKEEPICLIKTKQSSARIADKNSYLRPASRISSSKRDSTTSPSGVNSAVTRVKTGMAATGGRAKCSTQYARHAAPLAKFHFNPKPTVQSIAAIASPVIDRTSRVSPVLPPSRFV